MKISNNHNWRFQILLMVLLASINGVGCSEKDVPYVDDETEIQRYIAEAQDGRELFRVNDLISEDTFTIPNDPAVYFFVTDSVKRTSYFITLPLQYPKRYVSPARTVRDAELAVNDALYVRRKRILNGDTTEISVIRTLHRYAHFLKLGDDLKPFAGWKLFGYNGGGPEFPLYMQVEGPQNRTIVVDSAAFERFRWRTIDTATGAYGDTLLGTRVSYMRVDQIPNFDGGGNIDINCSSVPSSSEYVLLSMIAQTGPVTDRLNRPTSDTYSLSIQSRFSPPYLWNLLYFEEYRRNPSGGTIGTDIFCVPYRVP